MKPKQLITLHASDAIRYLLSTTDGLVEVLAGVGEVLPLTHDRPKIASPLTFEGSEVLISGLLDTVDVEAQQNRLTKLVEEKTRQIDGFENRLSNPGYVQNAKSELVEETRALLGKAKADLAAAQDSLTKLK